MPITFDLLMWHWEYVFISKKNHDGHKLIVMANDYDEFISELKKFGVYEEYAPEEFQEVKFTNQLSIFDFEEDENNDDKK